MLAVVLCFLFLVSDVAAVTNCGIGTDPFFQTVSYGARTDMWRADSIITEYDSNKESVMTDRQQHWETRRIDKKCVISRTVYMTFGDSICIYQQKIFPAVNDVYRIEEYNPLQAVFVPVEVEVRRVNATTIITTSDWSSERYLLIVTPHQSFFEYVDAMSARTYITFNAVGETAQDEDVKMARNAYEHGEEMEITFDPLPALVYRIKQH